MSKQFRKLISLVAVLAMLITYLPTVTHAAQPTAKIVVASVSAAAGNTVDVTISLENNPGLVSMTLRVNYDSEHLQLVGVTDSGLLPGKTHKPELENPYTLAWANDTATENYTVEGTIVTLSFKILDTAGVDEKYDVNVSYDLDNWDVYDYMGEVVAFDIQNGSVAVSCPHSAKTEVPSKSADCTASGNYLYYICDACGVAFKADGTTQTTIEAETIPATGHTYTAADCTTAKTCQTCGATEGAPLGHSFTNYLSNNDATCTLDGTKTAKCDRCDETNTIADAGSAKGHTYVDATCTTPKTCKVCNDVQGSALGHSYSSSWSKGENGHWHECTACGHKIDEANHDFGAVGDECLICGYARAHVHRLTLVPAKNANCTESGNKAYYTCSGCENWFEDASGAVVIVDKTAVIIAANGHNFADATCTAAKVCSICNATEGTALGHSYTVYISNNDATCTLDGTKTAKCDRCDETDTIADTGSAKGHDYADATCTTAKTCKVCNVTEGAPLGHSYSASWSKGEDGHWHECTACGHKIDEAAHDFGSDGDICTVCEYKRAHVHRPALVPGTNATCTEAGSKAYYTCPGCENWFEDAYGTVLIADKTTIVIPALGHSFTNYLSNHDATCTLDGTKTAKCDRCTETDTTADVGSAKGHDFADATCITPKTCKVCSTTEGAPLAHSYATTWSNGEEGHWHECTACGVKIDESGHDYGEVGDTCVVCQYQRSHIHRLTLVPAVDATCTEAGHNAYYNCSGCEDWFEDGVGTVLITDKAVVVIAATGHDFEPASCTALKTCKKCGATEGVLLEHTDANNDSVCDMCGEAMAPIENPDPSNPETGDHYSVFAWFALMLLSTGAIMECLILSKKRLFK